MRSVTNVEQAKTQARGFVIDQIDKRTTRVGERIGEHVSNLRDISSKLHGQGLDATAGFVGYAADRLAGVSEYLTMTDGDRMIHDVESVAREHALATAAIGLVAGLTAARVLKASASDRYRTYAP